MTSAAKNVSVRSSTTQNARAENGVSASQRLENEGVTWSWYGWLAHPGPRTSTAVKEAVKGESYESYSAVVVFFEVGGRAGGKVF